MFERCYSESYLKTRPSYRGCEVHEEWFKFSAFLEWCEKSAWEGRALDKDILIAGNKVYSSDTCLFVPTYINSLLTNCKEKSNQPLGVYYEPLIGKYRVQINKGSGQLKAGDFRCPLQAHFVWLNHKAEAIELAVDKWKREDPASFREDAEIALLERCQMLREFSSNQKEVKCLY